MNIKSFDELLAAIDDFGSSGRVLDVKTEGTGALKEAEIYSFVQKAEADFLEISVEAFRERVFEIYKTMKEAVISGLNSKELSKSGLSGENTAIFKENSGLFDDVTGCAEEVCKAAPEKGFALFSPFQKRVMLYSLATIEENARMGKIAACPTAGSSGIVPGVLIALEEELGLGEENMINALITAGVVGEIISEKMALAGAVAGCQAECGVASAMAAASCVYILGGNNEQVLNAAALALKNVLGLTCDPVAGLVEVPCVKRNVFMEMHSLVAAELSISGVKSKIPVDEIVDSMKETGDLMSVKLKESSEAGLATTKTGVSIENILRRKACASKEN